MHELERILSTLSSIPCFSRQIGGNHAWHKEKPAREGTGKSKQWQTVCSLCRLASR